MHRLNCTVHVRRIVPPPTQRQQLVLKRLRGRASKGWPRRQPRGMSGVVQRGLCSRGAKPAAGRAGWMQQQPPSPAAHLHADADAGYAHSEIAAQPRRIKSARVGLNGHLLHHRGQGSAEQAPP